MKTTFKKGDTVLIKKGLATHLDDENPLTVLEARSGYCRLQDVDGYIDSIKNSHITILKAKRGRPFRTNLRITTTGNNGTVKVTGAARTNKPWPIDEILENAEQVKSWNKYGECNCYNYFTYGLLVACVAIFTVMAMWSANILQIN